jgi:ComF family protein
MSGGSRRPPAGAVAALRRGLDCLLAVLFAPVCAACARPLDAPLAGPVCSDCWRSIAVLSPPLCDVCGHPVPGSAAACVRCRRAPRAVAKGRAVGPYEGRLRDIVHALKYGGRRSLAVPLAALMRRHGADVLRGADGVVPVPLHPARRRTRGFNQAVDLAAALGLPAAPVLRRVRWTTPQTDLPAAQRHRNVRGAFAVAGPGWRGVIRRRPAGAEAICGRCLVLIDDVSTTGATLEACARALRAAGAREVRALTVARVVNRRS